MSQSKTIHQRWSMKKFEMMFCQNLVNSQYEDIKISIELIKKIAISYLPNIFQYEQLPLIYASLVGKHI